MLKRTFSSLLLLTLLFSAKAFGAGLCSQVYILTTEDRLNISDYHEYLVSSEDGLIGFYLTGETFKIRRFSSLNEADSFYRTMPGLNNHLLSEMIRDNKILSKIIELNKFLPALSKLAIEENGMLKMRVKELQSLKEKIVGRIQSGEKGNRKYTLKELADTLGARLILPMSSRLLKFTAEATAKQEWAQALKVPESWISEVEIKGLQKDLLKEKYYSAIHLTIRGSGGETLELQVMSEAMSIWHKWDHANVYKSQLSESELQSLKPYSRDWSKILHSMSTLGSRTERRMALHYHAEELGIRPSENMLSLVTNIDRALRARHSVPLENGFTGADLQSLAKSLR